MPAVICTLGPACRSVDTLEAMINAGMSAARVDLTVCGYHCDNHVVLVPVNGM